MNPFLNLQWRRHFGDGIVEARAGYTYEDIPGVEDQDHRGYLLAHGAFDPAGPWRWGFTAERASDKTLFDRYGTEDPYQDNGLYHGDRRRLISQVYAEHQTERSYLSAAAFTIQSLRVLEVDRANPANNVFERDGVTPVAAPVIEAMWEPRQDILGGRLRLSGNAAVLIRENYVGAPVLAPDQVPSADPSDPNFSGYPGVDSARIVLSADWRRILTSPIGLRWEPFINLRGDAYAVEDLPSAGDDAVTTTRVRATAGLDVSYPLIRRFENGADLVLEPLAQISISNRADLDPRLPNEDSQVTDLDETSLFAVDRFTGHDLYEGGLRLVAGGRASLRWDNDRSASIFLGRGWRDEREDRYLVPTGDGTGSSSTPQAWRIGPRTGSSRRPSRPDRRSGAGPTPRSTKTARSAGRRSWWMAPGARGTWPRSAISSTALTPSMSTPACPWPPGPTGTTSSFSSAASSSSAATGVWPVAASWTFRRTASRGARSASCSRMTASASRSDTAATTRVWTRPDRAPGPMCA
ncbi:LPS-assembly protein LptD [Brevundimonas abyssalis]|uniref:Outer membrane protein Imp, required for envelope biogenesis / organic solvent tolerance protein n=1 Tax=Brevundimonas abyssalis TAR-001 TaxID=1391729 RepID=A0A8E0NAN6_9CAUL|nr:LPS assembly protein LptD [Brevundimonas abyssalis]GAD57885.1 outer membrane protein Imp, required for envelope biogenesis / organic solvent tolerance protein precursor [Brevundimonas abyssalis TAR-001]